jgi:hypothetical protein
VCVEVVPDQQNRDRQAAGVGSGAGRGSASRGSFYAHRAGRPGRAGRSAARTRRPCSGPGGHRYAVAGAAPHADHRDVAAVGVGLGGRRRHRVWLRPRRRVRRRAPPRSSHQGPGLLHPVGHHVLVPLDRPPGGNLAIPAMPSEQGGLLARCSSREGSARANILIRDSVHVWSGHPVPPAPRPAHASARWTFRRWAAAAMPGPSGPGLSARPMNKPCANTVPTNADPQTVNDDRVLIALPEPAASNRNCSRKARRSSVSPHPCTYPMHLAYRRARGPSALPTTGFNGQ